MFGFLKRKSVGLVPPPAGRTFPFEFPVFWIGDNDITVHATERTFGLARKGTVNVTGAAYDVSGHCWTVRRATAVGDAGRGPFGIDLVWLQYDFSEPRAAGLQELKNAVADAIATDPDDLWNQEASHEELVQAVQSASSFLDLARIVSELGGHGDFRSV